MWDGRLPSARTRIYSHQRAAARSPRVLCIVAVWPLSWLPVGTPRAHAPATSRMAGEKLLTMEFVVPDTHTPGKKLAWFSPFGKKAVLTLPDTAKPGETLTFQLTESIVSGIGAPPNPRDPAPVPAPAPAPAPVQPEEPAEVKLVTIKCIVPKTHLPGQKVVWVSPVTGLKVALSAPDTAAPGQMLTFQIPESIVTGIGVPLNPRDLEPVPAPAPEEPEEPAEKLVMIECDVPKTHLPGQKVVWVSPVTGLKVALSVPDTATPGQTLTVQLPERIVTAADEPAPAVPGEKLLTMEFVVPETHRPGKKLAWFSPFGKKVVLTLPDTAKPGETLTFQPPESIANGGSRGARAVPPSHQPSPVADIAASSPAVPSPSPSKGGKQVTLEVIIPADWKQGAKLATTLNGQRVVITPPDGAEPGMSLEFNVPASKAEGLPASPQAPAPPQPAPAAPPAPATPPAPPAVPAPEEIPQEPDARPVRATAVVERGLEQAAAQAVTSTAKVPVPYSKSALSEIYAQKTEAPWVKRASSDKYSMEAVRSKVPVKAASIVMARVDHDMSI